MFPSVEFNHVNHVHIDGRMGSHSSKIGDNDQSRRLGVSTKLEQKECICFDVKVCGI
jgi:hypothetical protein